MKLREYYLIEYPDSEELTEQTWFDECIILNKYLAEQLKITNPAYFVPKDLYDEFMNFNIKDCKS